MRVIYFDFFFVFGLFDNLRTVHLDMFCLLRIDYHYYMNNDVVADRTRSGASVQHRFLADVYA